MYRLTSRFKRDEHGAIAIISALTVILLCACVGGAIDFARYSSAKSADHGRPRHRRARGRPHPPPDR